MKLRRNNSDDGTCNYALIDLQALDKSTYDEIINRTRPLIILDQKYIEVGVVGTKEEFFVLKLKDKHTAAALLAYANAMLLDDPALADEIRELAVRSINKVKHGV